MRSEVRKNSEAVWRRKEMTRERRNFRTVQTLRERLEQEYIAGKGKRKNERIQN